MFWPSVTALILSFEIFRLLELKRWTGLYSEILSLTERTPEALGQILKKAGRVEPWAELLMLAGLAGLLFTPAWLFSLSVILLTILKEISILAIPAVRNLVRAGNTRPLAAILLCDGILTVVLLALALLKLWRKI